MLVRHYAIIWHKYSCSNFFKLQNPRRTCAGGEVYTKLIEFEFHVVSRHSNDIVIALEFIVSLNIKNWFPPYNNDLTKHCTRIYGFFVWVFCIQWEPEYLYCRNRQSGRQDAGSIHGTKKVQFVVDYWFSNGPPNTSNSTSVTTVRRRSNSWSIIDFQMDLRLLVPLWVWRRYDGGPIGGRLLIFKWTSKYK